VWERRDLTQPRPVLRDSQVEVLLLCGVTVTREKAMGGEPADEYDESG
jgi:hypothetical protein